MGAHRLDCSSCGRKPGTPHLPDCGTAERFRNHKRASQVARIHKRIGAPGSERRDEVHARMTMREIALRQRARDEGDAIVEFIQVARVWGIV